MLLKRCQIVYARGLLFHLQNPGPEVRLCCYHKSTAAVKRDVTLDAIAVRSVTTNCGNHCRETSDGRDVIKNWTKSLILEQKYFEEVHSKETETTLKRPPIATSSCGQGQYTLNEKLAQKFRRKMTDNSWTNAPLDDRIIWVDCEMTGLNPSVDLLIEIGVIVTDADLNEIATHESIVFHAEDSVLNAMDPWCIKHHGDSGLIEACKNSIITHEAADDGLLKFLQKYTKAGECPMAGNSIGQDRGFIRRQLPKFHSHFHYRDIDVSSIKELTRRWFPEAFAAAPRKKRAHRVLDDIRDSIKELQYYRSTVFTSPNEVAEKVAAAKR